MRTKFGIILAGTAVAAVPLAVRGDETPEAISPAAVYSADTRPLPLAVKTAAERIEISGGTWKVTWRKGDTVTLTAPDGMVSILVSDATSDGADTLSLNAGGVWMLTKSGQGLFSETAAITVRYPLVGAMPSPAKIVDGDELVDYSAGVGYTFAPENVDGLLSRLVLPPGCRLEKTGAGVYRLAASAGGVEYASGETTYRADSITDGPNRTTLRRDAPSVAYSGDDWGGVASKAATLTLTSPRGKVTTLDCSGTGATWFNFKEEGDWTVQLAMENGPTRTAVVTIELLGLTVIVF